MEWDESKHPRDDIGRFTDGNGAPRTYRQNASYGEILKDGREDKYAPYLDKTIDELKAMSTARPNGKKNIPFNFFGSKDKRDSTDTGKGDIPEPPAEVFGFKNKERLYTEHHVKHAREMGFKDQKDYERAAIEFWNSGQGKLYYSPLRKHYYLYDSNESLILSVDSGGIIQTFFSINQKKFDKLCIQERLYVY